MIKKIIDRFKSEVVNDNYFGEMGLTTDSDNKTYYLDKNIELTGVLTPVILYIESKSKSSDTRQQRLFEEIIKNFPSIWSNMVVFLTRQIPMQYNSLQHYRIESITIPSEDDSEKWKLDLLNLKDGFSQITIELEKFHPFHFSVKG
jgi:hypothetical protein